MHLRLTTPDQFKKLTIEQLRERLMRAEMRAENAEELLRIAYHSLDELRGVGAARRQNAIIVMFSQGENTESCKNLPASEPSHGMDAVAGSLL